MDLPKSPAKSEDKRRSAKGRGAKRPENDNAYNVTAVGRAIDVLEAFTQKTPELSLMEVAALTGLHKATAFRFLATLCNRGLVIKHPVTGSYRLGFGILALAEAVKAQTGLMAQALPVMRHIRDTLNETTFLSIRVGDYRIDIEQLEGLRDVRRVLTLGEQKPLYVGGASKVLLAAMTDEEIGTYLDRTELVPFSETTIVDPAVLWDEIAGIRKKGYAESVSERNSDGAGASAPIYGPSKMVLGTLSVSVPRGRYTEDLKRRTIAAVTGGAKTVSLSLGVPVNGHK